MSEREIEYGLIFLVAMVVVAAMGLFARDRGKRKFFWACQLFLVLSVLVTLENRVLPLFSIAPEGPLAEGATRALRTLWWLATAWLVVQALETLLWRGVLAHRTQRQMPKLLTDVVAVLVYLAAGVSIVAFVFHQPITGLLATSGVVAVVIGFALQNTLADVFAGIALNLEHPFRVGDWLRVAPDIEGEVTEMNWRATHIRTRQDNYLVLPNSMIAKANFTNYSLPTDRYATHVRINLPFDLAPDRAVALLKAAALSSERVLTDPEPRVRLSSYGDFAVAYDVKCWVTGFADDPEHRHVIAANIWRHLRLASESMAFPRSDIRVRRETGAAPRSLTDSGTLLETVDLFSALVPEERHALAQDMERLKVPARRTLVTEGEAGDSLFIVAEGLLYVFISSVQGGRKVVSRLGPGDIFGEMSLLTGEVRSATVTAATDSVVYQIERAQLEPLLRRRSELARHLGDILAAHRAADSTRALGADSDTEMRTYAEQIRKRISDFFHL